MFIRVIRQRKRAHSPDDLNYFGCGFLAGEPLSSRYHGPRSSAHRDRDIRGPLGCFIGDCAILWNDDRALSEECSDEKRCVNFECNSIPELIPSSGVAEEQCSNNSWLDGVYPRTIQGCMDIVLAMPAANCSHSVFNYAGQRHPSQNQTASFRGCGPPAACG